MYVKEGTVTLTTHDYDGSSWETTTATPQFVLDEVGGGAISHDCVRNVDTFIYTGAGGPKEGMFAEIMQDDEVYNGIAFTHGLALKAIYFLELVK